MADSKLMDFTAADELLWTDIYRLPDGVHRVNADKCLRGVAWALRLVAGDSKGLGGTTIVVIEGRRHDVVVLYFKSEDGRPAPIHVRDYIDLRKFRRADGQFYAEDYSVLNRGAGALRVMPTGVWTGAKSKSTYVYEVLTPSRKKLEPLMMYFNTEKILVSDYLTIMEQPLITRQGWIRAIVLRLSGIWGGPNEYKKYVGVYNDEKDPTKPATLRYGVELIFKCTRTGVESKGKIWRPTQILFEGVTPQKFLDVYSKKTAMAAVWRNRVFQKILSTTYLFLVSDTVVCPVPDKRPTLVKFTASDDVVRYEDGQLQEQLPADYRLLRNTA